MDSQKHFAHGYVPVYTGSMLDDRDVKKLSEVFVTKAEFNDGIGRIAGHVALLDGRVNRLEEMVGHIEATTDAIMVAVDKVAKSIDDLRHEYIAIKLQLDRHEKWIKEIAEKTGVTLSAA